MALGSDELWKRVFALQRVLGRRSHYQVLGVDQDADTRQLRAAYERLAAQFDPARHAGEPDPKRQSALAGVRSRIDEAFRVLASPEHRRQYDADLAMESESTVLAPQPEPDFNRARENTRFPMSRPVMVRCSSWDQAATLYTRDVSRGGIFLRTANPLEVGTPISVSVVLPDGREISLDGEVAYALTPERGGDKGPGIGVRFNELTGENRERFEEVVREARESTQVASPRARRAPTSPPLEQPGLPPRPLLSKDPFEEDTDVRVEPPRDGAVPQPIEPETSAQHVSNRLITTGHALIAIGEGRFPEAREKLTLLLKKDRDNRYLRAMFHLAYGYELKELSRPQDARKHFEMVLRYDKRCIEAIRELRGKG